MTSQEENREQRDRYRKVRLNAAENHPMRVLKNVPSLGNFLPAT